MRDFQQAVRLENKLYSQIAIFREKTMIIQWI